MGLFTPGSDPDPDITLNGYGTSVLTVRIGIGIEILFRPESDRLSDRPDGTQKTACHRFGRVQPAKRSFPQFSQYSTGGSMDWEHIYDMILADAFGPQVLAALSWARIILQRSSMLWDLAEGFSAGAWRATAPSPLPLLPAAVSEAPSARSAAAAAEPAPMLLAAPPTYDPGAAANMSATSAS